MADERPQFYENHLSPLTINTHSLSESLHELRAAVRNGAELIHENETIPDKWTVGGMFKHSPGTETSYIQISTSPCILDLVTAMDRYGMNIYSNISRQASLLLSCASIINPLC